MFVELFFKVDRSHLSTTQYSKALKSTRTFCPALPMGYCHYNEMLRKFKEKQEGFLSCFIHTHFVYPFLHICEFGWFCSYVDLLYI